MRLGDTCVVASTFQEAQHFTPATTARYRDLVERTGFVCALGADLPLEPVPGLRGATLARTTRCAGSGTSSCSPRTSAPPSWPAISATRPRHGPLLRVRPDLRARHRRRPRTRLLLAGRCPALPPEADIRSTGTAPERPARPRRAAPAGGRPGARGRRRRRSCAGAGGGDEWRLHRRRGPARPAAGLRHQRLRAADRPAAAQLLGRNCRFLQGPDSDAVVVGEIRAAVAAGREWNGCC